MYGAIKSKRGFSMSERRWTYGTGETREGLRYRVRRGQKGPQDLVMDIWVGRWVPLSMETVFLVVDFLGENEDFLYPKSKGKLGGDKLIAALRVAYRFGWERAKTDLEWEKKSAHSQRALF